MSKDRGRTWRVLAMIATFLAVGLPFWRIPYSKVNLPGALMHPGLSVAVISALLLCACRMASWRRATVLVAGAVIASVFARTVIEGIQDPTSHNLWPFEVIIAAFIGVACALPGALVGRFIAWWLPDRYRHD